MSAPPDDLLTAARRALIDVPREALGELVVPRRILGIARAPKVVPRTTAWHLGVLLLTDDALLATGEIVRSRHDAPRGYTAESQRQRSQLAAAAYRGGFSEGTPVHLGWSPLTLSALTAESASSVLAQVDGVISVRWNPRGGWMPLSKYLDERIDLLMNPPGGAT
ncbi:glutaminase [Microbacterium sp. NPDC076911]|uniref:glutaminase n=1 Tax=Microbacterium sp. NPDC076911 TaxID=3154958 RepID=UPI0034174710